MLLIRLPFVILKRKTAEELVAVIDGAKDRALTEIENKTRQAIHNAYAGIVCAVCGKNVFRGESEWVHGNGGRAYCLHPCWSKRNDK